MLFCKLSLKMNDKLNELSVKEHSIENRCRKCGLENVSTEIKINQISWYEEKFSKLRYKHYYEDNKVNLVESKISYEQVSKSVQ